MQPRALAAILALSLVDCAGAPEGSSAGDTIISVVGTPFVIAFKIPVCAATIAVAGPLAGASALTPGPDGRDFREALGEGIAANCGPPYVLTP